MTAFARTFFRCLLTGLSGVFCVLLLQVSPSFAAPQINNQINYQARLMDASGFPVADGNYSIQFSLYDASIGGNRIWTATGTLVTPTALTVNVQNGLFTVLLGDTATTGGSQNTLDTVNWNSDQIYLGVTINADSEMSPRKRFASAPQAFNARQLQGMYASSTASGGQSLFTINQTENNAATSTRTALTVRSSGTSNANDLLIEGVNDLGASVFNLNREGTVSSTRVRLQDGSLSNPALSFSSSPDSGLFYDSAASAIEFSINNSVEFFLDGNNLYLSGGLQPFVPGGDIGASFNPWNDAYFDGTVSTTGLTVSGQDVCLANGTNCPAGGGSDTLQSVTARGSFTTTTAQFFGGFVTASSSVTGTLNVAGTSNLLQDAYVGTSTYNGDLNSLFNVDGDDLFVAGNIGSVSSVYTNGAFVAGPGSTWFGDGFVTKTDGELVISAESVSSQPSISILGGDRASGLAGDVNIAAGNGLGGSAAGSIYLTPGDSLGNPGHLVFSPAGASNQPQFRFESIGGGFVSLEAPNIAGTVSFVLPFDDSASSTVLGTNGSGVLTFVSACLSDGTNCPAGGAETLQSVTARGSFTTTTAQFFGGFVAASSSVTGTLNVAGTSNLLQDAYVGTSSYSGELNPAFAVNGNDLFVVGNIGSASSVYTAGAFVAGTASTYYGDGYINKTDGNLTINASGGFITPATDLAVSLGSVTNRYNGIFGNTTSTNATTTQQYVNNTLGVGGIADFESRVNANYLDRSFVSPLINQTVNGRVAIVPVGTAPEGIVFDGSHIWVSNFVSGNLSKVDPVTNSVVATTTVGAGASGMVYDGSHVWVANRNADTLSKVDIRTNSVVATVPVGDGPIELAFDGSHVWVANLGSDTLNKVNVDTNSVVATTTLSDRPISVAFDGRNIWVGNDALTGFNGVVKVDISTNLVVASTTVSNGAYALAFDGMHLWAASDDSDAVVKIDIDANSVVATTTVGDFPQRLAFDGAHVWSVNINDSTLSKIDVQTNSVVDSFNVSSTPTGIAFDGRSIWVAGNDDGVVTKLPYVGGGHGNTFAVNGLLTVGGQNVCLADGTNCSSSGLDTLQSVTARGSFTTTTVQLFGGFVAASSSVTGTLTVLGGFSGTSGSFTGLLQSNTVSSTMFSSEPSDPEILATLVTAGSITDIYVNGKYAYASEAAHAQWSIIDITNPSFPSSTVRTSTGGGNMGTVKVVGNYAYVASQSADQLRIYDIRNKSAPVLVGTATEGGEDIDVQGQYAYLLDTDEFSIIDISNPATPRITSNFATSSGDRVRVYGRYAYLSLTSNGLSIVDISNPESPVPVGFFNPVGSVSDVIVSGNYAYVAAETDGIYVLDVSNPAAPRQIGQYNSTNNVSRLFLAGRYLYAAAQNLEIYDVSSSTNPVLTRSFVVPGDADDIFVQGRYAYLAANNGMMVVDLSGAEIQTANIGSLFTQFASISDSVNIGQNLTVNNGLMIGEGGILSLGALGVSATNTTSTFMGAVSTSRLSVGGFGVCLSNGTNCSSSGLDTLQSVTARGSFTTTTVQFFGGFVAASSSVTGTLNVAGTSNLLQNAYVGTSSYSGELNPAFAVNGNDLFVGGNIGSASSVYTAGAFVAGTGTTIFGDGFISKTGGSGELTIRATSGTNIVNSLEQLYTTETNIQQVGISGTLNKPGQFIILGNYAYVAVSSEFAIIDISNPTSPTILSSTSTPATAVSVDTDGELIYLSDGAGNVTVYDVSNKQQPSIVKTISSIGSVIKIEGSNIYTVDGGLSVYELFGINNLIGTVSITTSNDLVIEGDMAYVIDASILNALTAVDVSQPTAPIITDTISFNSLGNVFAQGSLVYVTDNSNALLIVDASDPSDLQVLSTTTVSGATGGLFVSGRYAYVPSTGGVTIVDVASSTAPTIVDTIAVSFVPDDIKTHGRYIYMTGGGASGSFQVYDAQGLETHSLTAHTLQAGHAKVTLGLDVGGSVTINGGLNVGESGIASVGALSVSATNTTSTFSGPVSMPTLTLTQLFATQGNFSSDVNTANITASGLATLNGDVFLGNNSSEDVVSFSAAVISDLIPDVSDTYSLGSSVARWRAQFSTVTTTNLLVTGDTVLGDGSDLVTVNGEFGSNLLPELGTVYSLGDSIRPWDGYFRSVTATNIFVANGGLNALPPATFEPEADIIGTSVQLQQTVNMIEHDRSAYLVTTQGGLQILDVSAPSLPFLAVSTTLDAATVPSDFDLKDDMLVVVGQSSTAGSYGIQLYNISNPLAPLPIGTLHLTNGSGLEVELSGRYALVTSQASSTMYVVDLADINDLRIVRTVPALGSPSDVKAHGRYAYVTDNTGNNLFAISLLNYSDASVVSTTTLPNTPADVVLQGGYAYVSYSSVTQYSVIDILDPTSPSIVTTQSCAGSACTTSLIAGDYLIQKGFNAGDQTRNIRFVDITASSTPTVASQLELVGTEPINVEFLARSGSYIYVLMRRVAFGAPTSVMYIVDTGGLKTESVKAASIEAGDLTVRTDLHVTQDAVIGGGLQIGNGFRTFGPASVSALSDTSAFEAVNVGNENTGTAWGAYIDQLLVGDEATATGTENYRMVLNYAGAGGLGGLCLDDSVSGATCPTSISGASIMADGAVNANAFDLAEMYAITGTSTPGDLLVLDTAASSTVKVSTGIPYDGDVIGIASTRPGFILGWTGGEKVALTGRVPTKVSMNNGPISVGDPLVSSDIPGHAMRANRPGMVVGYALEDSSATGTIEVFVNHGFWAGDFISATGTATVLTGDVAFSGKFYPPAKGGGVQTDTYLFVDNTLGPSSTYISTNASGWQSNDTYDFAERYYSPDELEPGDLVIVSDSGRTHVQRSLNEEQMLLGIVSTRPAFIAGRPATSTYPIALSGRVPTKISTINGAIKAGDPLAPTTIPGVAAKAIKTGPIVGLALEDYDQSAIGSIEVFVNPGWWTHEEVEAVVSDEPIVQKYGPARRGVAMIASGSTRVRIEFDSIAAYPFVQVTPRGLIVGTWGTDNYSDTGFDILLSQEQSFDAYFSWQVEPLQSTDRLNLSDGTSADIDPLTGQPFGFTTTSTEDIIEEPIEESVSTSTVSEPPSTEEPGIDGGEVVTEQPVVLPDEVVEPTEPETTTSTTSE